MKKFILLIAATAFLNNAMAQKTKDILKEIVGEGVKEGATIATEHTADKVTDKVLGSIFHKKNKKENSTHSSNTKTKNSANDGSSGNATDNKSYTDTSPSSIQTYSKYDFIPGDKVLVYEDFSQDAVGDFPGKWNTNSSGEVVTTNDLHGHWLMINKKGDFMPESINKLPEDFTLEFDLLYSGDVPYLEMFFLTGGNGTNALNRDVGKRSGVDISIQAIPRDKGGLVNFRNFQDGNKLMDNQVQFRNNGATKIKVSIWRQNQRLRVYLDQNKVLDLPRAFVPGKNYDMFKFDTWTEFYQGKYLVSNLKLAAGAPDTRNKLLKEGKFSTTGILFDVNSANIKPESYGTLKEIADVMKDNNSIKVKIIGHTDSDGDANTNMNLSKKRATAVKESLINNFGIDASRMETDGKGASQPIASNSTSEGKAQNRRVEFVKE